MASHPFYIEDHPAEHDLRFLEDKINQYNMTQVGAFDGRGLAIFIRNEHYEIIAGISGYTWAGMCEIEFLWVAPDLQRHSLGSQLLQAAELEARERNCSIMVLGSYSFQAPGFYERHGYQLVGQIENCPPNHTNYYFKKSLESNQ
jgi:GNAT superfamily N-acetyltransferase